MDLEQYRKDIEFIKHYREASNAATGSKVDSNANVENKNITTLTGEIPKEKMIGINRLLMHDKLKELYSGDVADEYIRQLDNHEIYKHDETSIMPYCVSITMYPYLFNGMKNIGGISEPPKNLQSFCGSFINLVFAVASQFAGAVSTPEFLTYMDYFIRKDYGDDYYKRSDEVVDLSIKRRTIDKVIDQCLEEVCYSLNQPAAARNYQSVFWNIAYFDRPYFESIFEDFVFPDGTKPQYESVLWLQKKFMNWFNKERLRAILTFPVETVNLLDDGTDYVDKEFADFVAEMWSKGHSFFMYRSNSVDSLASCCYSKDTYVLIKDARGAYRVTFEDIESMKFDKNGYKIFNNGRWSKGKLVKLPNRQMYKVTLTNNKEMIVTDNHRNNVFGGMKLTKDLTTNDYLMVNSTPCDTYPEVNKHLTYEQGFAVGAFLGDGSFGSDITLANGDVHVFDTNFSLSENKRWIIDILQKAVEDCGLSASVRIGKMYNNVLPINVYSKEFASFIMEWTNWHRGVHAPDKEVNINCVLQSIDFREGIIDGWFATDGNVGHKKKSNIYNSLRGYSTSKKLIDGIDTICNSLGYITSINIDDRRDEKAVFRGIEYNKNYPVYCLLKYAKNKQSRLQRDVAIFRNNAYYYRIKSIEEYDYDDYVYCFEMEDETDDTFTLANGIHNYNCRLRNELQDNAFSYTLGAGGVSTGSKCVITINFNRLVQDTVKDPKNINWALLDEKIREQVNKVHKYLIAYDAILKDSLRSKMLPIYDAGYINMSKQFLTCGINGLIEGAEYLGIDISPNDDYFHYCTTCLKPIYEENKKAKTKDIMFNTEYVPAENLGVKNAKWDKRDGYFSPRDCYNSYFYRPEDENCSLIDKFILHGEKTTKWLDGGSALHANLQEHLSKEQYKHLMKVAIKTGCSYFTFNVPNTICNDCGNISKHRFETCPNCGSENVDYATRVIGYLKRVSKFSEQRQIEEHKRYYWSAKDGVAET